MARAITYRPKSRNKYGNRKCSVDGYTFDSVKEMNHYMDLKYRQLAGEIEDLQLQVPFTLQESFIDINGKRQRPIVYKADFTYKIASTGEMVIEDVKSPVTANNGVYKLKKKMMLYRGLEVKEI